MNPLVSIIIPTYNRAKMTLRAIESVLAQSYKNFEIIIVDDGSTDDTKEVLSECINNGKIKYIFQNNAGPGAARNNGIQNAGGGLVAFLDSDDEWMSDKLEKQIKIFESRGENIAVFSNVEYINEKGEKTGELFSKAHPREGKIVGQLLADNFIATSSVIVPKHLLIESGGFPSNHRLFKIGEDHLLWLKIADKTEFYFVNEPLVKYYVHSGQIVSSRFKIISSLFSEFFYLFKNIDIFNSLTGKDIFSAFIKKFFSKLF